MQNVTSSDRKLDGKECYTEAYKDVHIGSLKMRAVYRKDSDNILSKRENRNDKTFVLII